MFNRNMLIVLLIGIFIVSLVFGYIQIKQKTIPLKEFICNQDSDCIIKDNNVNCVKAFHKDDPTEHEVRIPPGHAECPDPVHIVPYCNKGQCDVKYNCSECDVLRTDFEDFCPTHTEGTSAWICKMYYDCNC